MAQEVSILVTAQDHFSDTIRKMQIAQNSFAKDVDGLTQKLNQLNNNRAKLKIDTSDAKRALDDAKKKYNELGDAASRSAYEAAQANYDQAVQNLKAVGNEANRTKKAIEQLTVEEKKYNNRAASGRTNSRENGALAALMKSGLANMAGQSISNFAGVALSSAFGNTTGAAIGSIVSGVAQGASMGMVAGHTGAAIGAAVGAAAGVVNAVTQTFAQKDEAFKSAVRDQYSQVTNEQATSLASGSAIAAEREQFKIALGTLAGDQAEQLYEDIREFATVSPFAFDDLKGMSRTLLAGKYDPDEVVDMMRIIGDTGATLGLGADDMSNLAMYLSRMQVTGKATLEYLNPLMERGIPVFDFLAEALPGGNEEIQDMVSRGLIPGAKAAEILADAMERAYGGGMELQEKTFTGLTSTVEDLQADLDAAMGEGYNAKRTEGLQKTVDFMEGAEGDAMREAYEKIGAFKADLENQREEIERKHLTDVLESDEYREADAATQGMMLMKAKADAASEYAQTEGYQTQLTAEKELIQGIQSGMSTEYYEAGYYLGEEFEKGIYSARLNSDSFRANLMDYYVSGMPEEKFKGNAWGIPYVPHDNFITRLHEGERVLTASEARKTKQSVGGPVITGNNFYIREEADIDKIANKLYRQYQKAAVLGG